MNSTNRARTDPAQKPKPEDFSREAVSRAVLSQTVQHPATILPISLAVLGTFWNAAISATPESVGVTIALAFTGLAAWVWNYVIQGEKRAARHVHELRQRRSAYESLALEEFIVSCEEGEFGDGAKEARELSAAYERLRRFLEERSGGGPDLSAERFAVLAEDTFQQGLSVLQKALAIHAALRSVDIGRLEGELSGWRQKLTSLKGSVSRRERDSLARQIDAHEKRIARYKERKETLAGLLAEANDLETALETSHLQVVDLMSSDATASLSHGSPGATLERAVAAARSVEEKLRGLGDQDTGSDEDYLEAGKLKPRK
jgi:hypothetical protein